MIDSTSVLGYAKPMSVTAGEEVAFYLSSANITSADIRVVRVRCADPDEMGPGLKLLHAPSELDGTIALTNQQTHVGSCAIIEDSQTLQSTAELSVGCYLYPTVVGGMRQSIISRWDAKLEAGWRLELDIDGHVVMTVGSAGKVWSARSPKPLLLREWIFIGGTVSREAGKVTLHGASLASDGGRARSFVIETAGVSFGEWPKNTPLIFAAESSGDREGRQTCAHFNGKIDRPRLYAAPLSGDLLKALVERPVPQGSDPLLIGAWDFSKRMDTDEIVDLSAYSHHGLVRHLPMRAATGANWTGNVHSWTEDPSQYGAIHFHSDDLEDCGWAPSAKVTIPSDWKSGFYALQINAQSETGPVESYATFFLSPGKDAPKSKLAVIAPTATYLAYANNHARLDQSHFEVMADGLLVISQDDIYLNEHRELGHSTYDTHLDGSGVCYSSAARPILNTRPRANTFNYVNDTHLLDWLEEKGFDYDVISDEELHRNGSRALTPYQVVITMTHPEYYSKEMMDALETYQNGGGRHMYLGGNGFYWRIAYHPTKPGIIELRRGVAGTRSWEAEAGEGSLSFTGEPSGLWRSNGRAPQRVCGVGFSAQVFDFSSSYRRLDDSYNQAAAFVFRGVAHDEEIGNFGLRGGGAAGLEIDRADFTLGTAPNTLVLATADRVGVGGVPSPEELPALYRGFSGEENSLVRADMVLYGTSSGGAVFSTGSIAWCCALSCNNYDNNVSTVTENVLRTFLDPDWAMPE